MPRSLSRLQTQFDGPGRASGEAPVLAVGFLAIVCVLAGLAIFFNTGSYDVAVSMVVLLVILVVSAPVLRRIADRDDDPALFRILMWGLVVKMAFALVRYFVIFRAYGGLADAARYDADGWIFAQEVRAGDWTPSIVSIDGVEDGTRRIIKLTGYVYAAVGRSKFAGFFVFAWLAFWGALLFIRGARRAFPEMDHRRFTLLMLFFPSLLFWPASIGKDAVMVFLLGVVFYGASQLLGPEVRWWGIVPVAAGAAGMMLFRSHVALMAALSLAVATAFAVLGGSRSRGSSGRGRAIRVASLVVIIAGAALATTQTSRFFTQEAGEATSTEQALELTVERTQIGESAFEPIVVTSPAQIPRATGSVLFRPFPWEAKNVANLLAAAESLLLAGLLVVSIGRLRFWPSSAWRRPILIFAAAYTLMFVVAFSSIGNGGILARQRVQMLPFLLLAVSVPAWRWWKGDPTGVDATDGAGADGLVGSSAMGAGPVPVGTMGPPGPDALTGSVGGGPRPGGAG